MSNGKVRQFQKGKGFESIPREFLQQKELSMEAAFLLLNMTSYPESWILYKTELHKRFPKNGRRQIDRMWDECVEFGYILQYRKRVGKQYVYDYIFSIDKFTKEDIEYINELQASDGFEPYLKESVKKKQAELEIESEKEKALSESLKNQDVKNTGVEGKTWDVQNEQSNMDSPKRTAIKSITKRFITKKDEEDYNINSAPENTEKLDNKKTGVPSFDINNNKLVLVGKLMAESGVDYDDNMAILGSLEKEPELVSAEHIISQLEWCVQKSNEEGIYDFVTYFLNGLRKRTENNRYLKKVDFASEFEDKLKGSSLDNPERKKVPLYNWVTGESL